MRSYCPAWCGVKFHSKYPGFEGFFLWFPPLIQCPAERYCRADQAKASARDDHLCCELLCKMIFWFWLRLPPSGRGHLLKGSVNLLFFLGNYLFLMRISLINKSKFIPTNFKEIETKLIKTNLNTISSSSNLIHLPTQTQFTFHFAP